MREQIEGILPRIARPARYTGGELNQVRKQPEEVSIRFALAFPDIYEVGMSNLGLRILYEVLNSIQGVAAERVFAPALDMEAEMREANLPLFSLESSLPVGVFDFVGFSLSYELSYTTALNMLDLAGIPVRSRQRSENHPVVIAGGHCSTNPEPMGDFMDAFVIGDGEEAAAEIAEAAMARKGNRNAILEALADIPGVYVPTFHRPGKSVKARMVRSLETSTFPLKPVVPFVESVHDRANLEIMRGCTRGCRFCQAGMITRPVRERSTTQLCLQARSILANTGYDEVALTSLSSADHSRIESIVKNLIDEHQATRTGVSLPSLRADASCVALAEQIQRVRKSGLTFAPEAGTQRLRDTINKNVTEEDLLEAVESAVKAGWKRVKLYFMVGLPTETDEDVLGIAGLVRRVVDTGRANGVLLNVSVTLSPFVPKPHTPFQWRKMNSLEELKRKIALLQPLLRGKNLQLNWHDPACSQVEAALARGDRSVGRAVFEAWKLGSRLEQENFDAARWRAAFDAAGVRIEDYANRVIPYQAPLPWDHIDVGVAKAFLAAEDRRADLVETTADCRWAGCSGCGVNKSLAVEPCPPLVPADNPGPRGQQPQDGSLAADWSRVLLRFSKGTDARWLGHLDLIRVFERAIRMSGLKVAFSEGFNPRIRMSFSPALPLGATAAREMLVIRLQDAEDLTAITKALNHALPLGIRIVEARVLPEGTRTPSVVADVYEIEVRLPNGVDSHALRAVAGEMLDRDSIVRQRKSEKSNKVIDLRPGIRNLEIEEAPNIDTARLRTTLVHLGFTVKPSEIFVLLKETVPGLELTAVHRADLIFGHRQADDFGQKIQMGGGEKVCRKR